MSQKAVFLDRDGTLNREVDFLTAVGQIEVLPGVPEALARLRRLGYLPVVLTNQSGIARGLLDESTLARIHWRLHEALERLPAAYLHCPHLPDAQGPYGRPCRCRKPAPGLLHQARDLLDLQWEGSWLVGDSARDLLVGGDLPLRSILVQSGKPWGEQLDALRRAGFEPEAVCADLPAAVARIAAAGDPGGA